MSNSKRRILAAILGVFCTGWAGSAYVAHSIATSMALPKLQDAAADIQKVLPKIIADLEIVRQSPPFPNPTRKSNAEPVLSQHVAWYIGGARNLNTPSLQVLREAFKEYKDWTGDESILRRLYSDPRLEKIDTSWMEQLFEFDHWSLATYPKVKDDLARAQTVHGMSRIGIQANLPVPAFNDLQHWATTYAIQRLKSGKSHDGLKLLRHTARLADTTGSLVGNMVAVSQLNIERRLAEFARVTAWNAVDAKVINAYKAVSWAWAGIATLPGFGEFPAELEPYFRPEFGICGSALEAHSLLTGIPEFFVPTIVFEDDFSREYARAKDFENRLHSLCGTEKMAIFHGAAQPRATPLFYRGVSMFALARMDGNKEPAQEGLHFNAMRVPYLRRALGLILASAAIPNYHSRFYK